MSGMKTVAVASTRMAVNALVPGSAAALDFVQAAYDLWRGDNVGALTNVVSGVAEICTCGLNSSVQGAMKESAKKSTKEGAKVMGKKAGKEATKKFGQKVARQVAEGSLQGGKEAATKYAWAWAEEARKKATKKFGKRLGKEIGRGLIPGSVEKVFKESTKDAAAELLENLFREGISIASKDFAKNPKLAFEFAKIAEEGALKEFAKQKWKFYAKDVVVECVKAGIQGCSANDNIPT